MSDPPVPDHGAAAPRRRDGSAFDSGIVDRVRAAGNVWRLPAGEIVLPEVFGFCRGVKRALTMLEEAVAAHRQRGGRLFLLGQIIHNPWVNEYFQRQGVRILSRADLDQLEGIITAQDCAVVPAFGVPLAVEQRLRRVGCRIVDTSCGDVRRLWAWAARAAHDGYGVLIFGRANHDETVGTKSRLEAAGASYVVANSLDQTRAFCELIRGARPADGFRPLFGPEATNADSLEPFQRLAQVSQTTMLHDETMTVRELIRVSYAQRFGAEGLDERLVFQPTVCRATQARQAAAVERCRTDCDLVIVVGGFGSSNTHHLYELARTYAPAWFIENAEAIRSARELATMDFTTGRPMTAEGWLPDRRPLRIAVLAGASSPEVVVGEVLERLSQFLR
jgi:4-hydroxy-3-methylbut-2-enyl diphosphate reductase